MIYLDYYAAAPLLRSAAEAMQATFNEGWANTSSVHGMGQRARAVTERTREAVANALQAHPADIVLTAGGTEACALGIEGAVHANNIKRIVTTALEHPAVQECVARLGSKGVEVQEIKPANGALPPAEEVNAYFDQNTLLAMQMINHEVGAKLPVVEYARVAKNRGALVFVDAIAAFASEKLGAEELGADLLAVSSPKIGGPTGAGALFVSRKVKLEPALVGGMQERGRRAGTASTVLQAGFGAACIALPDTREYNASSAPDLRDRLEKGLVSLGALVNSGSMARSATVTNLSFEGWRSEWLVAALDVEGICISAGAACAAGLERPSPSVAALYPGELSRAQSAIRLSFGPGLDSAAIDTTLQAFKSVLARTPAQVSNGS